MGTSYSVAMDSSTHNALTDHLVRRDGQEDLCLATWAPSTGATRTTALIRSVVLPQIGERRVHGNASLAGSYVVRVAEAARERGEGVALLHSHPQGEGWLRLSREDHSTESDYSYLVAQITGLPLVGMTHAGLDDAWSARFWHSRKPAHAMNVRVIGSTLRVSWNDHLAPPPTKTLALTRTVSAWGERLQADLARLKVLVVGAGSVGLDVCQRLMASGIEQVGVMDYDRVDTVNLDRMIGATREDAHRHALKTEVAERLMKQAATSRKPVVRRHDTTICEADGLAAALDYDVIFSCVDRPWARGVLNTLAYADLIPVIDGGIAVTAFSDGQGMRSATWRTHVLRPGRPCMVCNGQITPAQISADRAGTLDDPKYIAGLIGSGRAVSLGAPNVALLSVSVTGQLLAQFTSLTVAPGGQGEPGPLQYHLAHHELEHLEANSQPGCPFEFVAEGDQRLLLVGDHEAAQRTRPLPEAGSGIPGGSHGRQGRGLIGLSVGATVLAGATIPVLATNSSPLSARLAFGALLVTQILIGLGGVAYVHYLRKRSDLGPCEFRRSTKGLVTWLCSWLLLFIMVLPNAIWNDEASAGNLGSFGSTLVGLIFLGSVVAGCSETWATFPGPRKRDA